MISLATKKSMIVKASLQPKIYTEMMTIRLEIRSPAELSGEVAENCLLFEKKLYTIETSSANVGSNPKQSCFYTKCGNSR